MSVALGISLPAKVHEYPAPLVERKKIDLTDLKAAKLPIIFIVGGPGSGKGTQSERIVAKYGLEHLSSGDLLRQEVDSGSQRGEQLSAIMKAGKLVPLPVVLDLIKEAMVKAVVKKSGEKHGCRGFLIDGYPRDVAQGVEFEEEIQPSTAVLYFDVTDEETLVKRLLKRAETSGRSDDNIDTIRKRLDTFKKETAPVVKHYQEEGKLVHIKADGTVEDIFKEVEKRLDQVLEQ